MDKTDLNQDALDYARGFADGFKAGVDYETARRQPVVPQFPPLTPVMTPVPQLPFTPALPPACGVCGMRSYGPMGYVCPNSGCPGRIS